ncbi:MAG: hypothetical protein ACYDDO_10320 [Acidiferrobacterales bacterium]
MKSLPHLKSVYTRFIAAAILAAGMGQSYAAVTIPNTFSAGTPAVATQVNDNFTAVKNAIDPLQISNYTEFVALCSDGSTDVTAGTFTKLGSGTHSFSKSSPDTKIEVHVNSTFSSGTFAGGTSGIAFQIEVDGVPASPAGAGGIGVIFTSGSTQYLSLYAVFQGLTAGSHTVSLWAEPNAGTSTGVYVDSGCWGGTIIVKEVR